ncbi:MAG: hypothetical protein IJM44_06295, partial [Ruminococcus sp.]|nr:hypothetical protein [Ruminococcus sp.]
MKKLICLLLALGMMTAAFSCGDNDEDAGDRKSAKSSVSDDENEEEEEETTKRSRRKKDEDASEPETEPETEEETTEPPTEPATVIDSWQDVYYNKLMEVIASSDYSSDWDGGTCFSLEDLDADGTPELFLSYDYSHPVEVYTCEGGELVYIGEAGEYGYVN